MEIFIGVLLGCGLGFILTDVVDVIEAHANKN